MDWSEEAWLTIGRARADGESKGLSGAELLRHIDDAYPFGPRAMWPYKAWLKARRQLCGDLPGVRPLPLPAPHKTPRVAPMPGQLSLLDGD